jgi:hypothetical protein
MKDPEFLELTLMVNEMLEIKSTVYSFGEAPS